jgi:hypothetical protein
MNSSSSIRLKHNLKPDKFMWLWMKYVKGFRDTHHCTNSLLGKYSSVLSKSKNPELESQTVLTLNEYEQNQFKALYICGVAKKGYSQKKNYPLNFHAAILPEPANIVKLNFLDWELEINNGRFLEIPVMEDLPNRYSALPEQYTTCRIFRWAACFFK